MVVTPMYELDYKQDYLNQKERADRLERLLLDREEQLRTLIPLKAMLIEGAQNNDVEITIKHKATGRIIKTDGSYFFEHS